MFSLTVPPPPTPNNRGRTTNMSSTAVKAKAICWDVDRTILRDKNSRKQTQTEETTVPLLYNPINKRDAQTMRLQTAVSGAPPQNRKKNKMSGERISK